MIDADGFRFVQLLKLDKQLAGGGGGGAGGSGRGVGGGVLGAAAHLHVAAVAASVHVHAPGSVLQPCTTVPVLQYPPGVVAVWKKKIK